MADSVGQAILGSISGKLIQDVVDYMQEKILKDRQSRSEDHWQSLQEFWKMSKLHNVITERLIARQRMCKILVFACSVPGYDLNQHRAMINWKQEDWEELMKNLAQLFETNNPYDDENLKVLYISCAENMLLANIRRTLEDDIKHKDERETVSLSDKEQKKFQDQIKRLMNNLPDGPAERIGRLMTKLHERTPLTLRSPTELDRIFCKKPFLFDWVIEKIESVVGDYNNSKFNGEEAVLWNIGYDLPHWLKDNIDRDPVAEKDNQESPQAAHRSPQNSPTYKTPQRYKSPSSHQSHRLQHPTGTRQSNRTPETMNQNNFLRRHQPVVLGSVQERLPPPPAIASPPRSSRKRNTAVFDDNGRAKFRRKWTEGQTRAIIAGLKKFGKEPTKWALILKHWPVLFEDRTSVMIKDRYRTLKKAGQIPEDLLIELGELPDNDDEV